MDELRRAIDALIQKAKLSGQLSHDEIIDALSCFDVGPDTFDEILERLVDEGVEVVDDADDEDAIHAVVESAQWEREPEKIHFDTSARELLKWATWIALCSDAREVGRDHLLEAAQAEFPPPRPAKVWDIPFSSQVQVGLAEAYVNAEAITRSHILKALGSDTTRPKLTLDKVLGGVRQLLEKRGIESAALWSLLGSLAVVDCLPKPEFTSQKASRRLQRIASEFGSRPLGQELSILLSCVISDTPVGSVLKQAGVTEELVLSLFEELPPGNIQPPLEISPELGSLLAGEPLTSDSLRSLELAWRFSDRKQLRPDDLLPTLLVYGSQADLILEGLGALHGIQAAIPTRVRLFEGPGSGPSLSSEIQTVLKVARQAAGDSPVDTGHLLLGLAEIGHPLVAPLKHRIREALDRPL